MARGAGGEEGARRVRGAVQRRRFQRIVRRRTCDGGRGAAVVEKRHLFAAPCDCALSVPRVPCARWLLPPLTLYTSPSTDWSYCAPLSIAPFFNVFTTQTKQSTSPN